MPTIKPPIVTDVDLVVSRFAAAWNAQTDPTSRRHLCAAWNEQGWFQDPVVRLQGPKAIGRHIAGFRQMHPGARLVVNDNVERCGEQLHLSWTLFDAQGTRLMAGAGFGELDHEGRLRRFVSFFKPCGDALPA
jgi:hypothetical protein